MKFVVVILVLVLIYLFYPFRDLYVRVDPFARDYRMVEEGFWTLDACRQAALARNAEYYRCRKHTLWSGMFNTYRKYGEEGSAGG